MRGIEKMEEFPPSEFWQRCFASWYELWQLYRETGDVENRAFFGELANDAIVMAMFLGKTQD